MLNQSLLPQFIAALIGGMLPFLGMTYTEWKNKKDQRERLRRALITEIDSCNVGQLHHWSQLALYANDDFTIDRSKYMENSPDHNFQILDYLNEVDNDLFIDQTIDHFKDFSLSTKVFDKNADKIGIFKSGQSNAVIEFYQELEAVSVLIENLQSSKIDPSQSPQIYNYYFLNEQVQYLAKRKRSALLALGADEYIEVKPDYSQEILKDHPALGLVDYTG